MTKGVFSKVIYNYLKISGYSVDKDDLNLQLISNPDYPSVKSITDTLDYFGIDNLTATVPKDSIEQLPDSFLAVVNKNKPHSIALLDRKKQKISLLLEDGSKQNVPVNTFKVMWEGIIIAVEKNNVKLKLNTSSIFKNPELLLIIILGL